MSIWLERARARQQASPPLPPAPPPPPPPIQVARLPAHAPPPPPPEGTVQAPASYWLKQAIDRLGSQGSVALVDEEIARILSLPFIPLGTPRCPDRVTYGRSLVNHAAPEGFTLRDIQLDSAYTYEVYGGLLGPQGVGWGKCCPASCEFLDLKNGRRSVSQIGIATVHALGEDRAPVVAQARVFESGAKPCVRITTSAGRKIELSLDHPVFTPSGWTHAGSLQTNALIGTPECVDVLPIWGYSWTEEHVRLLGYLIADGATSGDNCNFVDDNVGTLADVEQIVAKFGGAVGRAPERSKATRLNISGLRPLIREWGIDCLSKHKRMPSWCWAMPDDHAWALLAAMLTCDGHLRGDMNVEYCSASELLMKDVQFLMQRLGVHGRVRFKKAWIGKKRYDAWTMVIAGADAQRLLNGTGPWRGQETKWAKFVEHHRTAKHNTNVDIVPIGRAELQEIGDELGWPKRGQDPTHSHEHAGKRTQLRERLGATGGQFVSRKAFGAWVKESGYSGKYAWLGTAPLRWDAVKSVESIGIRPVFDLSVPGPASFVGNGVYLHNTLVTILCATIGLRRRGHRRAVILVPPEVFDQLLKQDLPWARKRLALDGIAFWAVQGDKAARMRIASQPGPGVFLYAYSSLSTQTGYDELAAICPTLFIMDEAQCIASEKSARTKRLFSIIKQVEEAMRAGKLGPDVKANRVEAVALSGTITKKSLRDYAYVARRCLHELAPMPLRESALDAFCRALDADVEGTGQTDLDRERMRQLVQWSRLHGFDPYGQEGMQLTAQEGTREAYRFRLNTAQGVVATSDASVDCSLIISWSEPPRPESSEAERLVQLMTGVVKDMKTPDGDVIEFGMHTYKWLWELTAGFYNSLVWPSIDELRLKHIQRGKPITEPEAAALLQAAKDQHKLKQEYYKQLRYFLDYRHQPGCDSPMLVAQEIVHQMGGSKPRYPLPIELKEAYRIQKEAYFDDLPERRSVPVRVCDYKIKAAVEWCRHHDPARKGDGGTGGMAWFHHPEVGQWLHEYLLAEGITHTMAFAGDNEAPRKSGLVISSYAHGTGKNLQHQCRNLIIELRREAATMEQMLGRTHRAGQLADDVRADVFVSNGFDTALFNSILRDSDYIQSTTGMKQRLCYATYAPIVPPTNPRLAYRLGIVPMDQPVLRATTATADSITPADALDLASVFRSATYGSSAIDTP